MNFYQNPFFRIPSYLPDADVEADVDFTCRSLSVLSLHIQRTFAVVVVERQVNPEQLLFYTKSCGDAGIAHLCIIVSVLPTTKCGLKYIN